MADTERIPNRERIQLWVDALRSGNYRQGKGFLRNNGAHCCLGVACDISGVGEWDDRDDYFTEEDGNGYTDILPPKVAEWYGLPGDPALRNDTPATVVNDDWNWSFEQIADAIEKRYLQV